MHAFRDGPTGRTLSPVILLAFAIFSAFLLRSWFADTVLPPPPRMQGETTQSYRYASMISRGEPIPAVDPMVMHPEGMTTSDNSIFEEYIAGGLYRLAAPDMPFDAFLRVFCLAFPLLGMAALYLWLSETGLGVAKSLTGAIAYGFLLPAMLRARGESFYRETVALPLILFLCWSVEKAVRAPGFRASLPSAALSAVFLTLCNASWKVSGFIVAALLFYILVMNTKKRLPLPAVVLPAVSQIASALLIPHMVSEGAILSPASITAFALLVSALFRITALPVITAAAAAVTALFGFNEATGHVSSMILAKIRFFFVHPADPSSLAPDARLFWVGGYETPTPGEIILLFGPLLILSTFGMRKLWRRGPTLLRWAVPATAIAYLMMDRLHVLLAPVLLAPALETLRSRWRYPAFGLLLALQSAFVVPYSTILESAGLHIRSGASLLTESELGGMVAWASTQTSPDESFLSYWHISGFLSAYAGRPVVTNTFFESPANRRNIHEFATRMFQPEDSLVAMMEGTDADYLVYQADFLLDDGPSGLLYLAGHTDPPEGSAALLMQYRPGELRRLELVFQGPSLRVFSLGSSQAPPCTSGAGVLFDERYSGLFGDYQKAMSAVTDPMGTAVSLANTGRMNGAPDLLSAALVLVCNHEGSLDAATGILQELLQLHLDGLYPIGEIADDFHAYLAAFGPDPLVRLDLARLYLASGMQAEATSEIETAILEDPDLAGSAYLEGLEEAGGVE